MGTFEFLHPDPQLDQNLKPIRITITKEKIRWKIIIFVKENPITRETFLNGTSVPLSLP